MAKSMSMITIRNRRTDSLRIFAKDSGRDITLSQGEGVLMAATGSGYNVPEFAITVGDEFMEVSVSNAESGCVASMMRPEDINATKPGVWDREFDGNS